MMRRTTTGLTLGACSALLALACSTDSPTASSRLTPDVSPEVGSYPPGLGDATPGTAQRERLEVCKVYVTQPGTVPPALTAFSVTGPGDAGNFSLAPNGCMEAWLVGGDGENVSVTETVPDGYTSTFVRTIYNDGVISSLPSAAGPTSTSFISGRGGDNAGPTGELVVFTNTEEVNTGGCSLTLGYWKTHSSYGPAPFDAVWNLVPGGQGANTTFYLSGKTWYQAFWTAPGGNAYYILAHQFMAARLNVLAGADPTAISAALASATTLFNTYTPAQIATLSGSNAIRKQFVSLAGILGSYNEGTIGPGHCQK
jgi:hypothetical protein